MALTARRHGSGRPPPGDGGRLRRNSGGELSSWRSYSMLVARFGQTDLARPGSWGSRAGIWGTQPSWPPELPAWKLLAFRRLERRSWPQRWLTTPRNERVFVRTPLATFVVSCGQTVPSSIRGSAGRDVCAGPRGAGAVPGRLSSSCTTSSAGHRLALVSNTQWRSAARYRATSHVGAPPECFDAYVTSLDVGFRKPHTAMFEHALELLGVDAEQAVMVGDSPGKDMAPAKKLGMRAVLVAIQTSPPPTMPRVLTRSSPPSASCARSCSATSP